MRESKRKMIPYSVCAEYLVDSMNSFGSLDVRFFGETFDWAVKKLGLISDVELANKIDDIVTESGYDLREINTYILALFESIKTEICEQARILLDEMESDDMDLSRLRKTKIKFKKSDYVLVITQLGTNLQKYIDEEPCYINCMDSHFDQKGIIEKCDNLEQLLNNFLYNLYKAY